MFRLFGSDVRNSKFLHVQWWGRWEAGGDGKCDLKPGLNLPEVVQWGYARYVSCTAMCLLPCLARKNSKGGSFLTTVHSKLGQAESLQRGCTAPWSNTVLSDTVEKVRVPHPSELYLGRPVGIKGPQ